MFETDKIQFSLTNNLKKGKKTQKRRFQVKKYSQSIFFSVVTLRSYGYNKYTIPIVKFLKTTEEFALFLKDSKFLP